MKLTNINNFLISKKNTNILLIFSICFSIYCGLTIGQSWDQGYSLMLGKITLDYFFSFGAIDNQIPYSEHYSTLYYTTQYFLTNLFPSQYRIEISHLVNLAFSLGTIYGIKKLSKELFNYKVANITFVILFFFPIYFGHMSFNSKDTILAFSHVWIVYLIFKYLKNQNIKEKSNSYVIYIGILASFATGIKFPFLGSLIPIFLFMIIDIFFFKKIVKENFKLKRFFLDIIKCFFIFYFLLVIFWIEAHPNIITLPLTFLEQASQISYGWPYNLTNGSYSDSNEVPPTYFLINLIYKSPEYFLISYVFFLILMFKSKKFFSKKFEFFNYKLFFIISILIFPSLLLSIMPFPMYDGVRLFLWSLPYFCIIPALTIYYLIKNINHIKSKLALLFVSVLIFYFLFNFFSMTPYQYTYLNSFVGDKNHAYQKFENDYWGSSLKELIKKANFENNKTLSVATCGVNLSIVEEYLKRKKNINFKLVHSDQADFIIMTNRVILLDDNINNSKKLTNCFDKFPGNNFSEVKRNGLILSVIRRVI